MYVIGTAGHVDHGKSALVRALTGVDPDRLAEEKARGLTIDLGFAQLTLPNGGTVSVVDVPGHERFIKNMLAGVGGIDLALLVIAADEGVMPQTREHLAILDLLGIDRGVVALAKADRASEELIAHRRQEAVELLAGTSLAGAPVVPCSAVTGDGLPELLAAVEAQLGGEPRPDRGRPRLPIDRAFTMPGFGTVVTGTLIDGALEAGQEVEVQPGRLLGRIRGLQHHGDSVQRALPGRRTAVNLSGITVDELRRGMVVTRPGTVQPTKSVDATLRTVRYLERPVKHNLRITFHSGAAEAPGRLLLLDADELAPGEEGWVQVRLDAPVAVQPADRFILRDPNGTIGGGTVVDTDVRRHRRFDPATIKSLEERASGSPEDALLAVLGASGPLELDVAARKSGLEPGAARAAAERLCAEGRIVAADSGLSRASVLFDAGGFERLAGQAGEALSAYHRAHPLRAGVPREELRSRLGLGGRAFDAALRLLLQDGRIAERDGVLAAPGHRPELSEDQRLAAEQYLASLAAARFAPSTSEHPPPEVLAYLKARGDVVDVGGGVVFSSAAYDEMVESITGHLRQHPTMTLAQVRDLFGTSRKYAQALLEHLDAKQVTRRVGNDRVLRKK